MSVHEVDGSARPDPAPRTGGGIGGFADRWPFRRKLNVLVGVPLVVVAVLLAYVIAGLVGRAQDAAASARLVRDSRQVAELVDLVETEHQQALLLSVRYESATSGKRPSLTAYRQSRTAVDNQVRQVRDTFGSRLPAAEAQVLKEIEGLSSLRSTIEQSYLPADNIDPAYTATVDGLIDGLGLDLNKNLSSTRTGSMLDSLLRAEAAHSSFETSVFSAQTGDTNALIEFNNAVGYEQLYTYQAARFGKFATEAQHTELTGIEMNPVWNGIALQYAGLQIDPSSLEATDKSQVRAAFSKALRTYPDYQKQAQHRLAITGSLIDQIAHRADRASDDAWWRAAWLLGGALLAFVLWLGFSVAVRRSVIRPVQVLTGAATQVAEVAGLELARVADDEADFTGAPRLQEVPVTAHDEIGDLAEAFNRVQSTAAALLERQVVSRRNVAEMFGNVGRRVSNLTARQLTLIDALERGETDAALLDRLYRIDHLAVRLQRNADSLMLLAGIREAGLDASPTALTNVVRAALGQIEGYQRVSLLADTDVTVAPDIIADLTLMLAELLENAVAFSPARSPVEVTVRDGGDGALIEITDHGLGMSAERLAEENARLIRRERLDLVPTKVLGLFVVGSLARRWGVRVTLARTPGGGVTSRVTIPAALLLLMSPFAEPAAGTTSPAGDTRYALAEEQHPLPGRRGPQPPAESGGPQAPAAPVPAPRTAEPAAPHGRPDLTPLPRRVPQRKQQSAEERGTAAHAGPAGPAGPTGNGPGAGAPPQAAGGRHAAGSRPEHARTEHDRTDARADSGAHGERPYDGRAHGAGPDAAHGGTYDSRAGDSRTPDAGAGQGAERGADEGPRPLRRRVRGATLATTLADAGRGARRAPRTVDAEEVRSELDEFEAAVERANRDVANGTAPGTTNSQAGLPEGADQ
ncbi:Signal transduction histidine kinase [Actinacidiphila alni]|uniref:histidine kinase n=1 Tax=Actinacidiphila alni TaxID=380248 RepID=A0A1I2I573_9ACTN|nr:ATP-binding protein [Actinacidiphila alni]SFF35651.1 Signal transduction histidine kinase [Actinacidiphila alni]